ncbi:MAG: nucleotidyltransferase domain-containing protein [Nitrospirae bacterium]|nr:nucleotidyltransferase domain-containing protein [Nitrospirota bacterium]
MNLITEDLIQEITKEIVNKVNPLSIILFGSYAKNNAGVDSDLDFLVIEDKPFGQVRSRRKEMIMLWHLLKRFRIAKDILIYSIDEVDKWKTSKNHIIARAINEGKVLYERH